MRYGAGTFSFQELSRKQSAKASWPWTRDSRPPRPKVAFYLFMRRKEPHPLGAKDDILMIQAFDALAAAQCRNPHGFRWTLDCPRASDSTKILGLSELAKLRHQRPSEHVVGTNGPEESGWRNTSSSVDWYDKAAMSAGIVGIRVALFPRVRPHTRLFAPGYRVSLATSRRVSARVTISAGIDIAASDGEADMARSLVRDGAKQVVNLSGPIQIVPNATEDFYNPVAQVSPMPNTKTGF
ncbi:hypothetical protein A1O7_01302 [Cladophialophora yegresii CBS 114405]|uniref:Uncharacterized protein n=1 Tax=Cladophialophora yegresii CBS 114405 TaxID=1182544 RepID=W9WAK4_9EURO|nr:uncharacterized protein A1O7_01302 [Cladophialophora yegresii CBS 114405]EXJ64963.1 hypothetical protein A1O7_01302 [Cladophialophora yegresii CBS 114405]